MVCKRSPHLRNSAVVIDLFANEDDSVSFEICTGGAKGGSDESAHARGVARLVEPMSPARVEIAALNQVRSERFNAEAFYVGLTRAGLDYGTALQGLKTVYADREHLLAHIAIPGVVDSDGKDYALHPSLLEATAQACMLFVGGANTLSAQPLLPVAIDSLTVLSACEREMYAWIRYADRADDAGPLVIAVALAPVLRTDHQLRLMLGGAPTGAEATGDNAFLLHNVDRGTHTHAVEVVDSTGATVTTSAPVKFHMLRVAVGGSSPAPTPKPKPKPKPAG